MNNQHTIKPTPALIGLLVLLGLTGLVVVYLAGHPYYDRDGTRITGLAHLSAVHGDQSTEHIFVQIFTPTQADLGRISFMTINNTPTDVLVVVTLHTANQTNTLINTTTTAQKQSGQQRHHIPLPSQSDSAGQTYTLIIRTPKDGLNLLPVVSHSLYPQGRLTVDGEEVQNSLAFNFEFKNKSRATLLTERLTVFKPGIFTAAWGWVATTILLIGTMALTIYYMARTSQN